MKYFVYIALALVATLFTMASAQDINCELKPGMSETQCQQKISKGCGLVWVGAGCCKKEKAGKCIDRWDDGGCKGNTFCGFNCKEKCTNAKSRGCKWTGSKCTNRGTKTSKPTKAPTKSPTKKPTQAVGYESGEY